LRIALGVTIVAGGITYLANWHERSFVTCAAVFLAVASSALVVIGLITPVASIMVAVSTIAAVLPSLPGSTGTLFDTKPLMVDVIVMSIALAFLGPGAFSLDARLFGRREIIIPNTSPSSKF